MNITGHKVFKEHPINNLFNDGNKRKIQDWVIDYENVWLDHLENSLGKLKIDYSAILWRNFTKPNTNKIYKNFKQLDVSWPEYSAKLEGKILPMPAISNFPRMDDFIKEDKHNVIMDKDWFEEEMSLQEDVADFIRQSYYHNNHPNEFGHLAWAIYIAKQAGWANV
jgi:hypothetical protein